VLLQLTHLCAALSLRVDCWGEEWEGRGATGRLRPSRCGGGKRDVGLRFSKDVSLAIWDPPLAADALYITHV